MISFPAGNMKGQITSIPLILMITFTLTVTVLISQLVLTNIQSATNDDQIDQETLDDAISALGVFDYGIIFVNISFYLASFIFAYQIRSNPIYFIPSFIFLAISVWFSGEIANMYMLFAQTTPLSSAANAFPKLTFFYKHLMEITILMGSVVAVLLYGKTRTGAEVTV